MIVYTKSLKYSPLADKEFTEAEIINYSQVDAERLVTIGNHITSLFFGPIQIMIGLIMMYIIAKIAVVTTITIILFVLTVSYFLSKINARLNQ
jgi:hypothetical protein